MTDHIDSDQKQETEFPVGSIVPLSRIQIPQKDTIGNAADTSIAPSLMKRKSHCTACGDSGSGCSSCKSGCETDEKSDITPEMHSQIADDWIAEISFKARRKVLFLKKKGQRIALSDLVLVESEHGTDAGIVSAVGKIVNLKEKEPPVFSIIRAATKEEYQKHQDNRAQEKEIIQDVKLKAKQSNLEMKVVDAEWQFDKTRLSIYFTAPQRVDFRELVKDLARCYHARIELRQIPAREEAKRIGGIGPCGLELCCSTFLNEFSQINLEHAKAQQLPPNISKLSGMCGRLKCCLLYEIDNYISALKNYPPLDSYLHLPEGRARMIKVDIFSDNVTAISENSGAYLSISLETINELRREGKVEFAKELHSLS